MSEQQRTFSVTVERKLTLYGTVVVTATDEDEAWEKAWDLANDKHTDHVRWYPLSEAQSDESEDIECVEVSEAQAEEASDAR